MNSKCFSLSERYVGLSSLWLNVQALINIAHEPLTLKQYCKYLKLRQSSQYTEIIRATRLVSRNKTVIKALDEAETLIRLNTYES
jgi:hypothetical protein